MTFSLRTQWRYRFYWVCYRGVYYMTSKGQVISVERSIKWRRIPFVYLFSHTLKFNMETRYPPWKAWHWWNLVKGDIGDLYNRRRISNESKTFRKGKQATAVSEKVQLIQQFYFFLWKAQKKAYACSMILTVISDFPLWRGKLLQCIVRDRRQETQNIKLCLALRWLFKFDVRRFGTLWLLSLTPT